MLKFRSTPRVIRSLRSFYDSRTRSETIFAPASSIQPVKGSPLGIVRLSGIKTGQALRSITKLVPIRNDADLDHDKLFVGKRIIKPRRATLTKILSPHNHELIDYGLVLWFPAPNSYTGEDVCELHLHGSRAIMSKVLTILGDMKDLRPAEPGEFTRRAVLNGKMSLIQAECLPDLISAQTDQQRKLALRGFSESTKRKYEFWIQTLVNVLAHLEASIDFGEDELIGESQVVANCIKKLNELSDELGRFIDVASRCRSLVQSGARVVILGPPNAGKSTLMNLICQRHKSIVSDLGGTTRDVVEHSFDLGGHSLTLSDTAGLKDLNNLNDETTSAKTVLEKHNKIEREGIRSALKEAKKADLILYVVDGGNISMQNDFGLRDMLEELTQLFGILNQENRQKVHLVVNKTDLNNVLIDGRADESFVRLVKSRLNPHDIEVTLTSCKTQRNLNVIVGKVAKSLDQLQLEVSENKTRTCGDMQELDYVNERHLSLLSSVEKHLKRAAKLEIDTIDIMAQHVRESVDYLSRIVGTVTNEQVIDIIFKDFCIGK